MRKLIEVLITYYFRALFLFLFLLFSNVIRCQEKLFENADSIKRESTSVFLKRYHISLSNNCVWAKLSNNSCILDAQIYDKLSKSTKRKFKKHIEEICISFYTKRKLIWFLKTYKNSSIKKLKIIGPDSAIDNSVFEAIKLHSALEELEINGEISELPKNLKELVNLKNLILNHYGGDLNVPINLIHNKKLERFVLQMNSRYRISENSENFSGTPTWDIDFMDEFDLPQSLKTVILCNNMNASYFTINKKIPQAINNLINIEEIEIKGFYDSCNLDINKFKKLKAFSFFSYQTIYWSNSEKFNNLNKLDYLYLFLPNINDCPDFINYIDTINHLMIYTNSRKIELNQKYIRIIELYGDSLMELGFNKDIKIDVGYFTFVRIKNLWDVTSVFNGISLNVDSNYLTQVLCLMPEKQQNISILFNYGLIKSLDNELLKKLKYIQSFGFLNTYYLPSKKELESLILKIKSIE